jgi:hypothetical protein
MCPLRPRVVCGQCARNNLFLIQVSCVGIVSTSRYRRKEGAEVFWNLLTCLRKTLTTSTPRPLATLLLIAKLLKLSQCSFIRYGMVALCSFSSLGILWENRLGDHRSCALFDPKIVNDKGERDRLPLVCPQFGCGLALQVAVLLQPFG